jgi:DNA-binding winged helix-turn-helix (wHTH) protein
MNPATNATLVSPPAPRPPRSAQYRFGDLHVDLAARSLCRGGVLQSVQPKTFDLLAYLIVHRERAVGRDELISAVWGRIDISDAALAQAIRMARKVLGDSGRRQTTIRTLFGFGYQWIAADEESVDANGAAESSSEQSRAALSSARVRTPAILYLLRSRRLLRLVLIVIFALATCGGFAVASALSSIVEHLQKPMPELGVEP